MYCILFNGPPGVGKDTAVSILEDLCDHFDDDPDNPFNTTVWNMLHLKFAHPLKEAVHCLFGMAGRNAGHFEECKNYPMPEFFGMTPRECYIAMSERFAKEEYGPAFFGKVMVKELEELNLLGSPNTFVLISDCGFHDEVAEVVKAGVKDHFLLVRLSRDGSTYANDSRSSFSLTEVQQAGLFGDDESWRDRVTEVDIENNGTVDELQTKLKEVIASWVTRTSSN